MKFPRRSGVLLHPTSLPGPFGIGDLGVQANQFIDFLLSAGQSYWQVLPLNPTGYGDSPYQGLSAFAGNPMLIDLTQLVTMEHLAADDLKDTPNFPHDRVDFGPAIAFKMALLEKSFEAFDQSSNSTHKEEFDLFCREQASWLDDFALFMALKESYKLRPWNEWKEEHKTRQPAALETARETMAGDIKRHKYWQWIFLKQWLAVKQYANDKGIRIIGDIPIFVALDSADVWANTGLFYFDEALNPTVVSGVPPDYFSKTGQLWGHPLYRWDVMKENGYRWWINRFNTLFLQADVLRIDHFRGFHNYWEVPSTEATAIKGQWMKGPGADIFRTVTEAIGDVAIIAEDLGDFDDESRAGVDALQNEFNFPGMKILQFAFSNGPKDPFLPHNFTADWVVYTGTHDNDTSHGWYRVSSEQHEQDYARKYMGVDGSDIAWDLIRLGWASVANTSVTTVHDLLSLGTDARMNTPGTVGQPNWCWRLQPDQLHDGISQRLLEMTGVYGRLP